MMRLTNSLAILRRFSLCLALTLGFFQVVNFAATESKIAAQKNQKSALWQQKTDDEVQSIGRRFITPGKYLVYGLNRNNMSAILDRAPLEFTAEAARVKPVILEIPAPDGTMMRFRIEDSPILSPEVAAGFPGWKTFQGYGVDDPTATARFDFTPSGFHAYILSSGGTFAIDPFQENDRGNYIVYNKSDLTKDSSIHCSLDEELKGDGESAIEDAPSFSNGAQIRTYRLAVATTFEYTTLFGGATQAFNQVVTSVNRVSGVYRKELAVSFTLVSTT
ncbi:MAG: zinc-dependent metalloprotease, partial [Pyrinomonadaceae bacterium]|nr:zinc-dependent metalloprotease [Pyrinomonadaceae bacterium]